jgi:putative ABC transport system permease protein
VKAWLVLRALLAHWRRHRVELATLVIGLAVATALWSGVQALNAEARTSYARAASVLGAEGLASVVAQDGGRFALDDFVALRRAGWPVSPVLEGDILRDGASLRVIGIDPLTLPPAAAALQIGEGGGRFVDFVRPPWFGLAAAETADRLEGSGLPALEASDLLPADTIVVDIGAAERLLGVDGEVSRLILPEAAAWELPDALAARLRVAAPEAEDELARLTDSFHLNLTAFGFLSFVVGLFIVYSAIGLAFEERKPTLRTLRACGVSARMLASVMLAELLGIALLAGALGVAAGYGIAAALLPDVAASLRGLYGARVAGSLSLAPSWWLAGLAMSLAGALAAAGASLVRAWRLPVLAAAQPEAWRAAQRRGIRVQLAAAAALAVGALAALAFGRGLWAGFAVMGGMLLAAALLLPAVLAAVLERGARAARRPSVQWIWADARQQVSGLSLALMALLVALAVNIGVGTMVESFRATFLAYLDQRLAQEVYVQAQDDAQAVEIAAWLEARPDVSAVLPLWSADTRVEGWPVEVNGLPAAATYRDNWPMIEAGPAPWNEVAAGDGALVSEQTARRLELGLGDAVALPAQEGAWSGIVAGIYADYGNPAGEVIVGQDVLAAHWPGADRRRVGARAGPAAVPGLLAELRADFALPPEAATDQAALKALSTRIFDRTFAVTVALNGLTLGVAGVALLTSLLALADARLVQVAPVWALGLTRRRLAAIELGRAVALAALTAIAALPLGLALAWVLTAVVNVRAFGWRLPVQLFPDQWLTLLVLALATAALAAAWPAWRLRTASPLRLLQGFSNVR